MRNRFNIGRCCCGPDGPDCNSCRAPYEWAVTFDGIVENGFNCGQCDSYNDTFILQAQETPTRGAAVCGWEFDDPTQACFGFQTHASLNVIFSVRQITPNFYDLEVHATFEIFYHFWDIKSIPAAELCGYLQTDDPIELTWRTGGSICGTSASTCFIVPA